MPADTIRLLAVYSLGAFVILGCFLFIYTQRGDQAQAWTLAGIVVSALIVSNAKDRAYAAGAAAGASIPTVSVTPGPPASARIEPTPPQ